MIRIHALRARRVFAVSFAVISLAACTQTADHRTPAAARPASVVTEVATLDCGTPAQPCPVEGLTVVAARR